MINLSHVNFFSTCYNEKHLKISNLKEYSIKVYLTPVFKTCVTRGTHRM